MPTKMLRKWQYAAKRVNTENHPHRLRMMALAGKLDNVLVAAFPDKPYTSYWKADYEKLDQLPLLHILKSGNYCVACMETWGCTKCPVAAELGECQEGTTKNAYGEFIELLYEEN